MPGLDLMERAGAGVARARRACRRRRSGRRRLRQGQQRRRRARRGAAAARGRRAVAVVCVAPPAGVLGRRAREPPASARRWPLRWSTRAGRQRGAIGAAPTVIVDALLGTGFAGEPRGAVAEAIDAVNARRARSSASTCPAAWTPRPASSSGAAVRAAVTVTFHAAKPGLWINPGKAHAGEVQTIDIGIPRGAPTARSRADRNARARVPAAGGAPTRRSSPRGTCSSRAARAGSRARRRWRPERACARAPGT